MALGRRNRPQQPEDSNPKLDRLPLSDLTDHAEVELMMAGFNLSQWRTEARVLDPSKIDQAVMHCEWALEALRAIRQRDRAGLAR